MRQGHRERVYIIKDIILKLTEYGELNQTALVNHCNLNLGKHRDILDDLIKKGIITRSEEMWGDKSVIKYMVTEKGREFCKMILDPYERMFPRKKEKKSSNKVHEGFYEQSEGDV
jgi:predicted transcriptional regulator